MTKQNQNSEQWRKQLREGQKQFAERILNPPPIHEAMKEAMAEHDRLNISDDDTPID